jgi:hypothetical protein
VQHSKHIPATIANPIVLLDELAQRLEARNDPVTADTALRSPPHQGSLPLSRVLPSPAATVQNSTAQNVPSAVAAALPVDVRSVFMSLPTVRDVYLLA